MELLPRSADYADFRRLEDISRRGAEAQRTEDGGQRTEGKGMNGPGKRRLRHRTSNAQVSEDSDIE